MHRYREMFGGKCIDKKEDIWEGNAHIKGDVWGEMHRYREMLGQMHRYAMSQP